MIQKTGDIPFFYLDKTEPKGSIVTECGKMLLHFGYRLKILNTINFKKSMHYKGYRCPVPDLAGN